MLDTTKALSYYKRKDIQEAILENAKDREIAVKFGEKGFGTRPDILQYPGDILELAKQGATSFHASEELWKNPLHLNAEMRRKELDELRIGWDLVLDIDCPSWELAKITSWLLIKALKDLSILNTSVKFSGNKGFHIGVPFESFPDEFKGKKTKHLFPDASKQIALFILDYISKNFIKVTENQEIIFGDKFNFNFNKIQKITGKNINELTIKKCSNCNQDVKDEESINIEFICPKCDKREVVKKYEDYKQCQKCKSFMEKIETKKGLCSCGSNSYYHQFNPLSIIEVDTILISSRHLYRMPYSLHEKSGLVSLPINPNKVIEFDKVQAKPENIKIEYKFLNEEKTIKNDARKLLQQAFDFQLKEEKLEIKKGVNFEIPKTALQEDLFPPCMKLGFSGLTDGRKRFVFCALNFLTNLGWDYDKIEKRLKEWNKNNEEQLREVSILGQLRYHKQRKKKIPPPNCSNNMYYADIGICKPDNLCNKIKNPVQYAKRKVYFLNKKR